MPRKKGSKNIHNIFDTFKLESSQNDDIQKIHNEYKHEQHDDVQQKSVQTEQQFEQVQHDDVQEHQQQQSEQQLFNDINEKVNNDFFSEHEFDNISETHETQGFTNTPLSKQLLMLDLVVTSMLKAFLKINIERMDDETAEFLADLSGGQVQTLLPQGKSMFWAGLGLYYLSKIKFK